MICFHCKKEIEAREKIFRQDVCEFCGSYLHCCFNCNFYDATAADQCREPVAEAVVEKDRANFCDYFTPRSGAPSENKRAEEARKKLESLFRKKNGG